MKLGEQFKKEVVTVPPDAGIRKTAFAMRDHGVAAVVNGKGKPVGIVTDRDVALALGVDEKDPDTPVREIMPGELITIGENEGFFNATQYIFGYQVRRLPIVDSDGKLVGIVTMDDMLGLLARELGNLAEGAVQPVLAAKLEVEVGDINRLLAEGQELLDEGRYKEAISRFDQCLLKDPYLATAIDGEAAAYERLGQSEMSADLHERAALIRRELWHQESGQLLSGPAEYAKL
jgi:CBS domain-containing protein